jgi:hypothetical protein
MSTFDWTWTALRGGTSREADAESPPNGTENAIVPPSWVDCASGVKTLVSDRPALAVGIAFMVGVTLGWMIKR